MPTKWYSSNASSEQGLVIDEETGETIAIAMDAKHAPLIAAAPELMDALEKIADRLETLMRLHGMNDPRIDRIIASQAELRRARSLIHEIKENEQDGDNS